MKIKFFKKEKKFKKETKWFDMGLCWKIAVSVMFLATIATAFFGYYLFQQTNKEPSLPTGGSSGQVETVKKEKIDRVLEYFSQRKQKSDQIINSPSPIVDPSL